jgi:hypothetical protein
LFFIGKKPRKRAAFLLENFFVNYGNAARSSFRTLHPSRGILRKPNNPPPAPLTPNIKFPDQKRASLFKQAAVNMP